MQSASGPSESRLAKLDENITFSSPKHNPVYWTSQKLEAVSVVRKRRVSRWRQYRLISEAGVRYNTAQGHQSQGTAFSGSIGRSFPDIASLAHNRFHCFARDRDSGSDQETLAINVRAIVTREDARRARRFKAPAISVRARTSLTIS